ncbi:MAG: flavin reductase [Oscillospiraceae bacterium]|nr:flavin reductase [Oscillospiraceae bacterium]
MYCVKKINEDLYWVGGNDRRLALFENVYPIPTGVSYNAHVLLDEKTVLLDTVDRSVSAQLLENLEHVLGGRPLDYVIVNHMEPDHCATLQQIALLYPDVKIVCNSKTLTMIENFFTFDVKSRAVLVNEMDTLCTGKHTFAFVMAPMVHWPEAMVSYDVTTKTLFSADAFGTFGALSGNLYADEVNFRTELLDEARRYYTNIVGKYGAQVQALLKKASTIEIETICPLHGPVWRKDIGWFVEKYMRWATYEPEEQAVVIAYASVYGNTENAANILAGMLADRGVQNIKMYDVSATHPSYIVSECFRASHLVFLSTTYNAGMFVNMENLVHDIVNHNLQKRTIALVENGSWAPTAGALMRAEFAKLKDCTILDSTVTIRSSVKSSQHDDLEALADALVETMPKPAPIDHTEIIEPNAMFSLSYGLFVLTARDGSRDNGCIINTVTQLTDSPKRISIAVNKANLTHDMIKKTGLFNVSVLSQEAPFAIFQHYGFQSGRDVDKFADVQGMARATNGIYYIPYCTNAMISGKVTQTIDVGTHTLFIADVTEATVLSRAPSMTYSDYFRDVRPKPAKPAESEKPHWVCKICGYVYEGEELPEDYICPLCKHGADDFEKV